MKKRSPLHTVFGKVIGQVLIIFLTVQLWPFPEWSKCLQWNPREFRETIARLLAPTAIPSALAAPAKNKKEAFEPNSSVMQAYSDLKAFISNLADKVLSHINFQRLHAALAQSHPIGPHV